MNKKITELLKTSKEVIKDCVLPNGAIVAANSTKPYFPKEAKSYKFVWPRDAMYICIAANILGLKIQEQFFNNKIQVSVSPLCWSHSMFVIASKKLNYI